jgi:L-asparaginase / beta-aspartyl-peptidase
MIKLLVHGGAGPIPRNEYMTRHEASYRAALEAALRAGFAVLQDRGTSLDAVTEAVASLEDCPLFNAGRGSVLNRDGQVEMDASLMWGRDLSAGAVAAVSAVRNPIRVARVVMERSGHVMLVGPAADRYAASMGCQTAEASYLVTAERRERWESLAPGSGTEMDHAAFGARSPVDGKYGTVGAVAIDCNGTLAAGTSTGGMTNKLPGRIGDTPIVGAGTLADDKTLAVSFTGTGEHMIRLSGARSMSALVQHANLPLDEAARVILDELRALGGEGGLIAIDRTGAHHLSFNTSGMFRGWIDHDGVPHTAIYS